MKLKPIEQQVVVIVGATSGIGRETALEFARRGAKVVVSGRSQDALDALVSEIRMFGGEATAVASDVSQYEQVNRIAEAAVMAYGRIDTWVNSAAVAVYAPFTETTPEEFRRVVDVNLNGQAYGAMAALPHLRREGRGALISITSVDSMRAMPMQSAYSASKFGVRGFLDALRVELKQEGLPISVTNIMPASINTPFYEKALTRLGVKPAPIPPVYPPEEVAKSIVYAAEHPTRHMYVGGAGKGLGVLQRLSPRAADKTVEKVSMAQFSDQPKSANAPNNLYDHIPGYDQVKGTYDMRTMPASKYTWLQRNPVVKWAVYGIGAAVLAAGVVLSGRTLMMRRKAQRTPIRKIQRWTKKTLSSAPVKTAAGIPAAVFAALPLQAFRSSKMKSIRRAPAKALSKVNLSRVTLSRVMDKIS